LNPTERHDWILRPASRDDLEGICEVFGAYALDVHGVASDTRRNIEMTWGQPGFRMAADTRVAISAENRIAAYAEVKDSQEPHVRAGSLLRVHPDFRELGFEEKLLVWIEERASEAIAKAPKDSRVAVTQGVPDADLHVQGLLRDRGYDVIRYFSRMVIDLSQDIPAPVWPDGVTVRTFVLEEDLVNTVCTARDAFQDHWGHVDIPFEQELNQWDYWIRNDEMFDPTLTFLAIAENEIVGFSTCDPEHSEDPNMGCVNVFGVCRAWRRQGIALALLHHTFREFKRRGQQRVGLGVDATSPTGAHKLYEAAGMKPMRQQNIFEKELRAGTDLSLRTLSSEDEPAPA